LVAAVPLFSRWRLAAPPPVLTDDQIAELLALLDRSTPVGRRDYAIAVCLVDLALRVGRSRPSPWTTSTRLPAPSGLRLSSRAERGSSR
jgi:hypothetical protein